MTAQANVERIPGKRRCGCCGGTVECDPQCNGYEPVPEHEKDEDCAAFIDPGTDSCRLCGVDHSGECFFCKGRGFHRDGCELLEEGVVVAVPEDGA